MSKPISVRDTGDTLQSVFLLCLISVFALFLSRGSAEGHSTLSRGSPTHRNHLTVIALAYDAVWMLR